MTDIVSPAAGASAVNRATRRDIGIKRRYAAERRFRAYGQELAGLQWPGEGEPVLALHGWLDNAASFQPLAEPLGHPLVALACG